MVAQAAVENRIPKWRFHYWCECWDKDPAVSKRLLRLVAIPGLNEGELYPDVEPSAPVSGNRATASPTQPDSYPDA